MIWNNGNEKETHMEIKAIQTSEKCNKHNIIEDI